MFKEIFYRFKGILNSNDISIQDNEIANKNFNRITIHAECFKMKQNECTNTLITHTHTHTHTHLNI